MSLHLETMRTTMPEPAPGGTLPYGAIALCAATALALDPVLNGAPWWRSPDALPVLGAVIVPLAAWLAVSVGILAFPHVLGVRPSTRFRWGQACWITTLSGPAGLATGLVIADALEIAPWRPYTLALGAAGLLGALAVALRSRQMARQQTAL